MRSVSLFSALLLSSSAIAEHPFVLDAKNNVTYQGLNRNDIEVFLGIHYGQDTSGENRFKPPRPAVPEPSSTIVAQSYGQVCPQPLGLGAPPLTLTNVTEYSEDCLVLNVARPSGLCAEDRLPVMVYIHGGSFWFNSNQDETTAPDGLIVESIANGLPVIHVAMNYRLGFFGFSQSDALESEGSENAGLRDQRLAIEWVRDNIANFGGDPEKITIFGQSSGGLAVGLQILAYGGSKPIPFQQGICESQALEPGITGNFTIDAFELVVDAVGCNSSALHSPETVSCLRNLDTQALQAAAESTYLSDIPHNIGDIWLPVVDGDFLPAAPSQLIAEHRFAANVTAMMLWAEDDMAFFTDTNITTAADTHDFIQSYISHVSASDVDSLLDLYPSTEFTANEAANLSSEFYRTARIFRDILMVCEPVYLGSALAAAGNPVYLVEWNQTILTPILQDLYNESGFGVIHTSEFAYTFGNLSHYDTRGYAFDPTPEDFALAKRGSRTWSTFASLGVPGIEGKDTFQGFERSFTTGGSDETFSVFVAGGPNEGFSPVEGSASKAVVAEQRFKERCALINSDSFIKQLDY
ncbi:carboxylesterase family protein [Hypoxylon trugodes]|uniref:carboxylesterase family protein n=1 Tax=Hypoxylon trugodes TaxID=326681 RepID=UPI00219931FB|nr:carboxylesterase family protein [Hypoxylon trugodes]KAI1383105.1 carboxylesterase family protein [Hypoxylon trugodes]